MTALVQFNTLVASIQQNGKEREDSLRRGYIGETCEASFYCCIKPETSKYGCLVLKKMLKQQNIGNICYSVNYIAQRYDDCCYAEHNVSFDIA